MEQSAYDVIIIGGGAAGLFLASRLDDRLKVAVVEAADRVGKKLLATGNGKCNLSNMDMSAKHYNRPQFVSPYLESFSVKDLVEAFGSMGLLVKELDGRLYPYSECASSVLDVLRYAVRYRDIFTSSKVTKISKCALESNKTSYKVSIVGNQRFDLTAVNVVLASGSAATSGTDSVALFEELGHSSSPRRPSLAPIRTEREPIKGLQGVRVKAALTLNGRRELGEVLFKEFGLSGIASFNISSELARGRAKAGDVIHIDFMPEYSLSGVKRLLDVLPLRGLFHSRLQDRLEWANKKSGLGLAELVKDYPIIIEGMSDSSLAQVMSGGLNVQEFDNNLMSKFCDGAYAIGEALDVDGDTGGYNLHWAWASADRVAKKLNEQYFGAGV